MCCLFGMVNYSGRTNQEADDIINCLAREATIRGTDSTGIAYNKDGVLKIYKKPLNAYHLQFKGLEDCACVSGHTRHATQGSHTKNYNNHPFMGKCSNMKFALSHNGVLWNDWRLRHQYNLPKDRIETDSYIAVQLLQEFGELNAKNVAKMAEAVDGSFSFTMTDSDDTLWIVKGDSPLALIHFPHLQLYAYASTEQILFTALCQTELVYEISAGEFEMIALQNGDIMQIDKNGNRKTDRFTFYSSNGYYDWRTWNSGTNTAPLSNEDYNKRYLEDLKNVAQSMGVDRDLIQELYDEGFTLDELEEFVYTCDYAV